MGHKNNLNEKMSILDQKLQKSKQNKGGLSIEPCTRINLQ